MTKQKKVESRERARERLNQVWPQFYLLINVNFTRVDRQSRSLKFTIIWREKQGVNWLDWHIERNLRNPWIAIIFVALKSRADLVQNFLALNLIGKLLSGCHVDILSFPRFLLRYIYVFTDGNPVVKSYFRIHPSLAYGRFIKYQPFWTPKCSTFGFGYKIDLTLRLKIAKKMDKKTLNVPKKDK